MVYTAVIKAISGKDNSIRRDSHHPKKHSPLSKY